MVREWIEAARAPGADPAGTIAQELAARHVAWLGSIPGTPVHAPAEEDAVARYVRGLAELYVADERFSATYGGPIGAAFVRDALRVHVDGI